MAQYNYIKKDNSVGVIEANSPEEAIRIAPDIASDSGVALISPGTPSLPSSGGTLTSLPSLPSNEAPGTHLVGFKDSMGKVMDLAVQKRNELMKQFMLPFQGTVAASDFNQLFNQMNQFSTAKSEGILEDLIGGQGELTTETVGNFEVLRDKSGKILSTKVVSTPTDKDIKKDDIVSMSSQMDSRKGDDGFISPGDWATAKRAWISEGYSSDDFDKLFDTYKNPKDTYII